MSTRNVHVVPRDGEWAVRREGNTRATSVYSTQKDAVEAARKLAKTDGTEVVIHGRDGRIRERDNSYGKIHSRRKSRAGYYYLRQIA